MRARLVAALLLATLVAAGCGADAAEPSPPSHKVGRTLHRAVPDHIASVPLTTASGTRTTLEAYRGKVVVMVDASTLCQETCPLDTANFVHMARTLQRQGLGDEVQLLEVTMDPRRDTPARMRAYQKLYADPPPDNWTFVTGSTEQLRPLWRFFWFAREKQPIEESPAPRDWMTGKPLAYDMNHNDVVAFLDRKGRERFVIVGQGDARSSRLPKALRRFLNDQGVQDLQHPRSGAWKPEQALQAVSWLLGQDVTKQSGS